ncbi:MAG: hypothetical protein ACT4N4_07060 [Rhodospirillales bacterium]
MSQPSDKDAPGAGVPGLDQLAKRYMDLWQDQLAAMAADPELLASMSRLMAGAFAAGVSAMPGFAQGFQPQGFGAPQAYTPPQGTAEAVPNGSTKPNGHDAPQSNGHDAPAQAGAAAVAAAPDDRGLGVSELIRRLGLIEARLASLEAGIARRRGSADPRAEAGRPAKVRRRP